MKVAQLKAENAVLEPELRELCDELSAVERARAAQKFARWSNQLTASVLKLDPKLIVMVEPPSVPQSFFLVRLAEDEKRRLRELARECGMDLRRVMDWVVSSTRAKLQERIKFARLVGVKPEECWTLCQGDNMN